MKHALAWIVTLVVAADLAAGCGSSGVSASGPPGSDGGSQDGTVSCGDPGDRCCGGTACNAGLTCIGGQCVVSTPADATMDSSGSGDAGADVSGTACASDGSCGYGFLCCHGNCVNTANDPTNCGACGVMCEGGTYCAGSCQPASCVSGTTCDAGTCCGTYCCSAGQICCLAGGGTGLPPPVADPRYCLTPTAREPTCSPGCPLCL